MRRKRHYHNKQWHTDDRKKASIFFAKILAIKILASSIINAITAYNKIYWLHLSCVH